MISETDSEQTNTPPKASIFSAKNRGRLFDILIFIANLFLMRLLTRLLLEIFRQSAAGDRVASLLLGVCLLGMLILPALGATLKRWRYHERVKSSGESQKDISNVLGCVGGCVLNPLTHFALNLCIAIYVVVLIVDQLSRFTGKDLQNDGAVFLPLIFIALGFSIFQTFLIYRYLFAPEGKPLTSFFLRPESEYLGDLCLFVHMILFQVMWNIITYGHMVRVSSVSEFLSRLGGLTFLALLIYFPPRIFYLIEDIGRPKTWLTMLLANSPVLFRILIGSGT